MHRGFERVQGSCSDEGTLLTSGHALGQNYFFTCQTVVIGVDLVNMKTGSPDDDTSDKMTRLPIIQWWRGTLVTYFFTSSAAFTLI